MLESQVLSRWRKPYPAIVLRVLRCMYTRPRTMRCHLTALLVFTSFLAAHAADHGPWLLQTRPNYDLHYKETDQAQMAEYESFLARGITANEAFFQSSYPKRFDVYIHPDRASFDIALQQQSHQPNFHSPCWLVAVGESDGIHILAPVRWDDGACEGRYTTYADKEKTQKLITHELTHVFHGQTIRDHEMDGKKGLSWFEEGLAAYVSGQLGPSEIHDVQAAFRAHTVPGSLNGVATSDSILLRYSMMGSLVLYIDRTYGKARLKGLLQFDSQQEILSSLGVTEGQFLDGWRHFMLHSTGLSR